MSLNRNAPPVTVIHAFAFCVIMTTATLVGGARVATSQVSYDAGSMLIHAFELSADKYEGRLAGSKGNAAAREVLVKWYGRRGLESFEDGFEYPFELPVRGGDQKTGVNVIGLVRGSSFPDRYIVLSAHYDHLGVRDGEIYNGMDDNASGTAAVMAMAEYFSTIYRPHHSIIFALFDSEESGLLGAKEFVNNPPVSLDSIILDVNLDMVSRSDANELYASGTYHNPFLKTVIEQAAANASERIGQTVNLLFGHDLPGSGRDDWTSSSDHGPFFKAGIPHVYFGVEDHAGYHNPTDDFADSTPRFFVNAVEVILESVVVVDAVFESIRP